MNRKIDVLWVDDSKEIWDSTKMEAELENIRLHEFSSWQSAEKELEKDYGKWSAIILDAKCKVNDGDQADALSFLPYVLSQVRTLAQKHHHTIPWFVFSGDIEESEQLRKILGHQNREWDEREELFYDKNTDSDELWENIIKVSDVYKSRQLTITEDYYHPLFNAIKEACLHPDVRQYMIDLLLPIHFNGEEEGDKSSFDKIRKVLEYLFRSMFDMKMLPEQFLPSGKVNLTYCANFLEKKEEKHPGLIIHKRLMTDIMAHNVRYMINVTGSYLHSEGADSKTSKDTNQYLREVNNTKFLLWSFTFQLCDLLIWYGSYKQTHPDPEENATYWEWIKEQNKSNSAVESTKQEESHSVHEKETISFNMADYEGKEMTVEVDNGVAHCGPCALRSKKAPFIEGRLVKISEVKQNIFEESKDIYPFSAKFEILK